MLCKNCGKEVSVTARVCPECKNETGSILFKILDKTVFFLKKALEYFILFSITLFKLLRKLFLYLKPIFIKFFSVKRNRFIALGVTSALILIVVIVSIIKKPEDDNLLHLGDETILINETLGTFGGEIIIDEVTSPLYGLSLNVDFFSFAESEDFTISYEEVIGHEFGDYFTPITPLITVDYSHTYAAYPMTLTIPITLSEDEFAMGFFYDKETDTLEAIPSSSLSLTSITLVTHHFSSVVVSKISYEELTSITGLYTSSFDSGFIPGIDDWQFTNYGSYLAPYGHCAGQTITMGYYYARKHLLLEEEHLYGRFDNNGDVATTDFWYDDSNGYRFASKVQSMVDFSSSDFLDYINFGTNNEKWVYHAFAYALYITKTPQFMAIYSHSLEGDIISGHAILAYKLENGKIYVSDPNYPGDNQRYVSYSNDDFSPYSSGMNANQILADGTLSYDQILFVGTSAMINYDELDILYDEMIEGTIGSDDFPALTVEYLEEYDADPLLQIWNEIDESISLTSEHNSLMDCSLQNSVVLALNANLNTSVSFSIYEGTTLIGGPYSTDEYGYTFVELDLEVGINEFGILVTYTDWNDTYYVDFERITINYEGGVSNPCEATIVGRYDFVSRSDGQVLVTYNYIEIYANGTYKEEYQLNDGSGYISTNTGTWEVIPGEGVGENVLVLSMTYSSDYYDILDNYQTLSRTSGDITFIYSKTE